MNAQPRIVTVNAKYDLSEGASECQAIKAVNAWYALDPASEITFQSLIGTAVNRAGFDFHSDDVHVDTAEHTGMTTYFLPDESSISGPAGFGSWTKRDSLPPGSPTW